MDTIRNQKAIASLIDHTFLKADASFSDFKKLCRESRTYEMCSVAVNSQAVAICREYLEGSSVKVGAAVGFPLGQTSIETKGFETKQAIQNGAEEIDYVINITYVKEQDYAYVEREMASIVDLCKSEDVLVKVIFENCYLNDDEKKRLCEIALKVRPDFVKTSTGFGTAGAMIGDVSLMKSCVGEEIGIKASGGIKTLEQFKSFLDAGASRIGTSSGVEIIEEFLSQEK